MRARLPGALAPAGLLAFVAALCLRPMQETDLFFRLRVGEEILRTGALAGRNLFSFTYPDHPDPDPAWLFDVAVAALHRLGGFPAVVLAKTAVVLAAFAVAYALARRRGASPPAAAVALAAAALAGHDRFVERPHVLSLLGEVGTLAAILAGGRWAWAAVPGAALWANLHAGAFVAPALLALGAAGALIERERPQARRLALAAAGAAAALLATPVGIGIVRYLTFHVGLFAIHPVDEFRPPSWRSDAPLVAYAVSAAALLAAARGRVGWRLLLPGLGIALLAARTVRFGADFALLNAPALAVALGGVPALGAALARPIAAAAIAALLALASMRGPHGVDVDLSELPVDAIQFAERHGLRDRMYNDFEVGAYLVWEGWPRHRVFVDPRLPAYPLSFHRLLGRTDLDRAGWDAALAAHGVDTALLAYAGINRRISWWDPERWALVYRAHDARVFVRRGPRFRSLIAAREIPATFAFTEEAGARTLPLQEPPPGSPVPPCEWQRRLGDLLFELDDARPARALTAYRRALAAPPGCLAADAEAVAAAWVGATELGAHRYADALAPLERALALAPDDLATLTNRALALDGLGRSGEAAAAWTRVAARARGTPLGERAAARAGR